MELYCDAITILIVIPLLYVVYFVKDKKDAVQDNKIRFIIASDKRNFLLKQFIITARRQD